MPFKISILCIFVVVVLLYRFSLLGIILEHSIA